jgi:hypothetical protein
VCARTSSVSADDADDRRAARAPVRLRGDTYITITAPSYPDDDPLTAGERSIDTDHDMVFPDGYGSVAVTVRVPGGWDAGRREATLAALGADGREPLAARLRVELLPPLQRMLRRCGGGRSAVAVLPYFYLTYAGSTDHPEPGRAALDDALRPLVYPDSALPLRSSSRRRSTTRRSTTRTWCAEAVRPSR